MTGQRLYSRVSDFLRSDSDGNLFYGWRLVVFGIVIILVGRELTSALVHPRFVVAFALDFGIEPNWWHPAVLGIAAATNFPVWAVAGWAIDRYGPRRMVQVGLPLACIVTLLAFVQAPGLLTLSFAWIGTVGLLGAYLPTLTALNHWFRRRLVIALAVMLFAVDAGGAIIKSLIPLLVLAVGWTTTAAVVALAIAALATPLSGRVFNGPEDYGQHPDGTVAESARTLPDYGWREAMKSRQLWLLMAAAGCLSATEAVGNVYFAYIWSDLGVTRSTIGLGLGIQEYTGVIFILVGGWIGYLIPIRYALSGFAAIQVIGTSLLLLGIGSLPVFFLASALVGIGVGAMRASKIAVVGIYFGRRSFGANTIMVLIFTSIAGILAPPAAGAILDVTGEIASVIVIIAIVAAAAAVLFLALGQPRLAPPSIA